MDICLGVEKRLEDGTLPLRLTSRPSNKYVAYTSLYLFSLRLVCISSSVKPIFSILSILTGSFRSCSGSTYGFSSDSSKVRLGQRSDMIASRVDRLEGSRTRNRFRRFSQSVDM